MYNGLGEVDLLPWLLDEWPAEGPPVCILEGFSGIGKTSIANRVRRAWDGPAVLATGTGDEPGLDGLLFEVAARLEADGHSIVADHADGDFRAGVLDLMQSKSLIIVDDFDEFFSVEDRLPEATVMQFVQEVGARAKGGRLLLVTAQSPSEGSWLDNVVIKTMAPPAGEDAVAILVRLLKDRGLLEEVDRGDLDDIASWLGGNPRAMQAFVACLRDEPVQDLIDLDHELWDLRDQAVSPQMIERLERQFLRKTIGRLDPAAIVALENLSVFRRPFPVDALGVASPKASRPEVIREALTSRFLLTRDKRWYSLNPVARQLSLGRLQSGGRRRLAAHGIAADHYVRRVRPASFRDLVRTGGDFVEARYHLLEAGKHNQFSDLASQYRDILLANYSSLRQAPAEPRAAGQLLATLVAALDEIPDGYNRLRFIMAELLIARGRLDDERVAYRQVTLACRDLKDPACWLLRSRLAAILDTPRTQLAIVGQAIDRLKPSGAVLVIEEASHCLAERNDYELAMEVVNRGLKSLPQEQKLRLYSVAAFLLCAQESFDRAVTLLQSGYLEVGPTVRYSWRLFEQAAFIAFGQRDVDRLQEVKILITAHGMNEHQIALCDMLLLEMAGRYAEAAKLGDQHLLYPAIAAQTAFCHLVAGDPDAALAAYSARRFQPNSATLWLRGLIAARQGAGDVYLEAMSRAGGDALRVDDSPDSLLWVKVWAETPRWISIYPSFYFPCLPSRFTGLGVDAVRDTEYGSDWILAAIREAGNSMLDLGRQETRAVTDCGPVEPKSTDGLVINVNLHDREGSMGDTYNIYGGVGSVGRNAKAKDTRIVAQSVAPGEVDRQDLVRELEALLAAIHDASDGVDARVAEVAIEEAVRSANERDDEGVRHALKRAGRWAVDRANEVGVAIAAAAIEGSLGLGGS